MKFKAVILDVDGTLVDSYRKEVPISAIRAINELQEKQIPIIIATGRPLFCAPIVNNAGIVPDFFVGNNGTIACDKNRKIIFETRIEKEVFKRLKKYSEDHKISTFWKMPFGVKGFYYSEQARLVSLEFTNFEKGDLKEDELPDAISLVCEPEEYEKMKLEFPELYFVDGGWLVYDITNKGVSKVNGIQACLDNLHITFDDCIAFGDSENDIDMLKEAGLSICMGNGQESVKKECDYVTDNVENDGVYKALKLYEIL